MLVDVDFRPRLHGAVTASRTSDWAGRPGVRAGGHPLGSPPRAPGLAVYRT